MSAQAPRQSWWSRLADLSAVARSAKVEALAHVRARLADLSAVARRAKVEALAHVRARLAEALARRRVALGFVGGIAALLLARPTWTSLVIGVSIASVGEALRIWAAGHLEKSREVTQSGPYALMRHPLYVGSSIVGAGVAVAAWHPLVAAIAAVYLGTTIPAAMHAEEAHLREKFGSAYDAYATQAATPVVRTFSVRRAGYNREHHALAGLVAVVALLALKVIWVGADAR